MICFWGYGWKWENPPVNWWESYYANYLKAKDLDLRAQPFYLAYGGYVGFGSLDGAGSYGAYWSFTATSDTYAYYFSFDSSLVRPSYNANRYDGYPIRCLAR